MDWFTALEPPTQVAVIGVITALIAALAGVSVAIVNNRKAGGGKAEIAAMTIDSSSVKLVASAIEGLNVTLLEQNRVGDKLTIVLQGTAKEIEELRREVRELSDKMRSRA